MYKLQKIKISAIGWWEFMIRGGTLEYNFTWKVNPIEKLYELWPEVSEITRIGALPHLVGIVRTFKDNILALEVEAIAYESPTELIFADGDDIYFLVPINPKDGIEGAYIRILELVG